MTFIRSTWRTSVAKWPLLVAIAVAVQVEFAAPAVAKGQPLDEPALGDSAPLADDANLHDVQLIGSRTAWAVGDRGVAWNSVDGGRTWTRVPLPVDAPLRSVCFLTDQVGWIAGGGATSFSRVDSAVLLFTKDGGRNWEQLPVERFPTFVSVRFFDLEQGVAVGSASAERPSGAFVTKDGGRTWEEVAGQRIVPWRGAAFTSPEVGVMVGLGGEVSLYSRGRLLRPRVANLGLRGLRGVSLNRDDSGWLVGDGSLVLRTSNGGVSWEPPPRELPEPLRDLADFRTVASRGDLVWIGGSPGSVIWHSRDRGESWVSQHTGQPQPIHAIAFGSDTAGLAVGAFGTILHTEDGGRTWEAVRGRGRRAAMLAIHTRPERVSFQLLARESAEQGYRGVVMLPVRRDVGHGEGDSNLDLHLEEAVVAAGGSAGEIGWRFPVDRPGLDRHREKLLDDWDRRAEGRLNEIFPGQLVAALRTWRPEIVILDQPPADDATTRLVNQAVLQAVRQAADPTWFIAHRELAGLDPWQVRKVFARLPAGSMGSVRIDPFELLPRLGRPVRIAAAAGASKLLPPGPDAGTGRATEPWERSAESESYRLIFDANRPDANVLDHAGTFFAGLVLAPGSAARRELLPIDDARLEAQKALAIKQRNFEAIFERFLSEPGEADTMLAHLDSSLAGMGTEQAALTLSALVHEHRRRSEWDAAEAAALELIRRYPDQPASHDTMRWLFQLWSGQEPAWQRARRTQAHRRNIVVRQESVLQQLQRSLVAAQLQSQGRDPRLHGVAFDPLGMVEREELLQVGHGATWRQGAVRDWHARALKMAELIREKSPALYASPRIQFPLANMLREAGQPRAVAEIHRHFAGSDAESPWRHAAEAEEWMLAPRNVPPRAIGVCRRAASRPKLDGLLSDECWQAAKEIPLRTADDAETTGERGGLAMLAYDREFLYVAGSFPRHPELPSDPPEHAGRTHDADLSRHDSLRIHLDVDRNHATYYSLGVDQRGFTSDACWEDRSWNPQWYVAAAEDGERWRFEAAIPLEELVPERPMRGHVWGLGLVRVMPAVGVAGWTEESSVRPRPETFGLLRFE
ncbi:MAG: YCF48-related protein [Planctomycetaceae bacterium]